MKQKTFKPPRSITRLFPQVTKVIHAKKPVIIEVRPRDCMEGKKLKTSECALAKATKRQFKADGVAIRLCDSFVIKGNTAVRFATPVSVGRELTSFDRHNDFAEGTYRLSAAHPGWAKPGRSVKGSHSKTGSTDRHKHYHRTERVRTTSDREEGEK